MKKRVSPPNSDDVESLQKEFKALKKRVKVLEAKELATKDKSDEKIRSDSFRFILKLIKLIKELPHSDALNNLFELVKEFFNGFT